MAKKQKKETEMTDEAQTNGSGEATNGSAPTQTIAIDNIAFSAPAPYADGDTINTAEAGALNQTLGENLRNNFRKKVADAKEKAGGTLDEAGIAALQAAFAEYAKDYEFAGKRGTRMPVDPVEKEATKIAREKIREALKTKNVDLKTLAEGAFDKLVADLLARKPEYREIAAARIAQMQALAADILA
jgi:hypothetical protein